MEAQKQERLNGIINEFEAEEVALHKLNEELSSTALVLVGEDEPRERYEHMRNQHIRARERLVAINSETHEIDRDLQFFADHDVCPTCDQPITDQHFAQYRARVTPRLDELKRDHGIVNLDIQTTATGRQHMN
jgi:DNA repair exonuclease SbcCD ATPase subunit